jgi:hypothetical protein
MRIVTVLVALAALALVPLASAKPDAPAKPAPGFTCPVEDIANTACQGPKDCLYPHPTNCNQFIHCEVNADGVTGRPTVKDWPADLEWNDKEKICDWPSSSTCPGGSGHNPDASKVATAAAVPAHLKDVCSKQKPGAYADQKRCDCFYECDNNHAIHYECCKPGLLYQAKQHSCAAPREVQCGNRTSPAK